MNNCPSCKQTPASNTDYVWCQTKNCSEANQKYHKFEWHEFTQDMEQIEHLKELADAEQKYIDDYEV